MVWSQTRGTGTPAAAGGGHGGTALPQGLAQRGALGLLVQLPAGGRLSIAAAFALAGLQEAFGSSARTDPSLHPHLFPSLQPHVGFGPRSAIASHKESQECASQCCCPREGPSGAVLVVASPGLKKAQLLNLPTVPLCLTLPAARLSWEGRDSEGKGDSAGSWWQERVVSLAQGLCSTRPAVRAHPGPAHPDQVAPRSAMTLMASLGMPVMGVKWGGSGMSGREDDSLSHPSWAMAGLWREAASKQCWLCSKGKAAFVCQYGYSWVKSVVFYKSLLCLGAVGLGILGTRGKVQVAAPSRQTAACGRAPNHTLHLCLLKRALPTAEPDVELVSHSLTRPRPNPSAPLGLHGSCQGRKAASSGPRR